MRNYWKNARPVRNLVANGGIMRYVDCPKCGDPVAGKLTAELTCVHCLHVFAFEQSQVKTGIVLYNRTRNRWQAEPRLNGRNVA